MAIGLGRTYASAARNPGVELSSAEVVDLPELIEGVVRVFLRFFWLMGDWLSEERDCEKEGELRSRETLEAVADGAELDFS